MLAVSVMTVVSFVESQCSPLDYLISNGNTDINIYFKACSDREPNPNHIQTDFVVTVIEQMKELSK
jgi:hypothetical protein